jgi:hypothetical protein
VSYYIFTARRVKVQFRDALQKIVLFIFVGLPIVATLLAAVFGGILALVEVNGDVCHGVSWCVMGCHGGILALVEVNASWSPFVVRRS